jgi:hypothetical protein
VNYFRLLELIVMFAVGAFTAVTFETLPGVALVSTLVYVAVMLIWSKTDMRSQKAA